MKSFHKQFILTIFVVVCFCILLSSVIYGAVEDRENYSISYSYAKSDGNLQDFDSTDRHVFFACWNTSSVDVFNVDGAFEFSISFTDYQNGGIYLRAHDNFMYIMTKRGDVFIFDGDVMISYVDRETARQNGFDYEWFTDKERDIVFQDSKLYKIDTFNNKEYEIPISANYISSLNLNGPAKGYIYVFILVIVFFLILIKEKRLRKK